MAVTSSAAPFLLLLFLFNTGKAALPFLNHRFALLPVAAVLGGVALLLLQMLCITAVGDRGFHIINTATSISHQAAAAQKMQAAGAEAPPLPQYADLVKAAGVAVEFNLAHFLRVNVTMTSLMAMSLLVLVALLLDRAHCAWKCIVLDIIQQLLQIRTNYWRTASDLRGLRK